MPEPIGFLGDPNEYVLLDDGTLVTVKQDARTAVLERLRDAANRFTATEQRFTARGRHTEAAGAHRYALWVLRAYTAELDDPTPLSRA